MTFHSIVFYFYYILFFYCFCCTPLLVDVVAVAITDDSNHFIECLSCLPVYFLTFCCLFFVLHKYGSKTLVKVKTIFAFCFSNFIGRNLLHLTLKILKTVWLRFTLCQKLKFIHFGIIFPNLLINFEVYIFSIFKKNSFGLSMIFFIFILQVTFVYLGSRLLSFNYIHCFIISFLMDLYFSNKAFYAIEKVEFQNHLILYTQLYLHA